MSAYDNAIKNLSAAIASARAAEAVPVKAPTTGAEYLHLEYTPGQRVLDRITGQEGTVTDGTIEHSVLPAPAPDPASSDNGTA